MYRRKYEAVGLSPEHVRTSEDLAKVPLIGKYVYRCQGTDPFPYSDTLAYPSKK